MRKAPAPRSRGQTQPRHQGGAQAHRGWSACALAGLLVLWAASAAAEALKPFEARYRISVSKIPTPVEATMSLQPVEKYPGMYRMKLVIDSWLLSNREESVFAWRDCNPRTDHYIHEFEGLGRHRWHHMNFFRHPPRVVNESEEDTTEYEIEEDTLDELTLLLHAGCALEDGAERYKGKAAYGDEVNEHHIKVTRRETVDTPAGRLDTLVVKKQRDEDSQRRTLFWVAPALDYMVVRAKHIENPALFGELIMTEYRGPGAEKTE
jgi:hypothetical protein